MGFVFTGVFWGLFLLLLGASILIKVFFHIDIPVFRTFFGLFLVFLGLRVLLGRGLMERGSPELVLGATQVAEPKPGSRHEVVFGKGVVDLGGMAWEGKEASLDTSTVFGHSVIKLNPKIPTLIKLSAAFAGAKFPDGNVVSFGDYAYKNKAYKEGKPALTIKASLVFGALDVVE